MTHSNFIIKCLAPAEDWSPDLHEWVGFHKSSSPAPTQRVAQCMPSFSPANASSGRETLRAHGLRCATWLSCLARSVSFGCSWSLVNSLPAAASGSPLIWMFRCIAAVLCAAAALQRTQLLYHLSLVFHGGHLRHLRPADGAPGRFGEPVLESASPGPGPGGARPGGGAGGSLTDTSAVKAPWDRAVAEAQTGETSPGRLFAP